MKTLAGDLSYEDYVKGVLTRCGIEIVRKEWLGLVGYVYPIFGKLGAFVFYFEDRFQDYWLVTGDVPFAVATELYNNGVGNLDQDARSCSAPGTEGGRHTVFRDKTTKKILVSHKSWERLLESVPNNPDMMDSYQACDDPTAGEAYIEGGYCIHSESELQKFVEILKKHKLA